MFHFSVHFPTNFPVHLSAATRFLTASACIAAWLMVSSPIQMAQAAEIEIGAVAPDFTAQGVDGKQYTLKSLGEESDLIVLCFTCNNCPVAVAYEDRFIEFTKTYQDKKVTFVAINCNNQTENLQAMKKRAEDKGFNFIYAFDESGKAASDYQAKVTPEMFIIQKGKIAYHGAFDDKQKSPTKAYVVDAVDALLEGKQPEVAKTKAFGCGIKKKS